MPEELIRIPLAISYPKKIDPGQKSEKLVSNIDFAPAILDAAGLSFNNPVDGQSFLPLCYGESKIWRDDLMCETHGHFHIHLGRALITERYKYIYNERNLDELYDLKNDPFELNNLVHDPNHSQKLQDMKIRLERWRTATNDSMTKRMIRKIISQKSK
jgi:arylsulfatase A-like enzyme